MSNEPELNFDTNNPLTQAILDAADDLEKGKSLGAGNDPLAALASPLESLPTGPSTEPAAPAEDETPAAEVERETVFSRLAKVSPFTWSLWVSVASLTIAIVLLLLELNGYDWAVKATRQ